jgi:hypothetical protein
MKKLVLIAFLMFCFTIASTVVFAQTQPVFYGEWNGSMWMYWDGIVNSNQPAYAYYQNLDNGKVGMIELKYYSHDAKTGLTWWKSSGIVCGNINYYQVVFSFATVGNVPLVVDRSCTFLPMIRK